FVLIVKTKKTERRYLTESELSEPIVNYFLKNNIKRSCWHLTEDPSDCYKGTDSNSKQIDIKKNFLEIYTSNHHVRIELFGYTRHKECDVKKCDLITSEIFGDNYTLTERTKCYAMDYMIYD